MAGALAGAALPLRLWNYAIPQTDTRVADTSPISHYYLITALLPRGTPLS
ncbi:MAG: hypothetical protein MSG64_21175 [Pyrinomonadaceae bacterium MAG19_C2-C3]|nr:hypothetical protein [Pyrinomonadaceae bacterium MAG19_C2-C3]